MKLEGIELHDAQLKSIHVDYIKKSVAVNLEYYKSENALKRSAAILTFEKVESVSHICNIEKLQKNASAGNIAFWHPSKSHGSTELYLVGGLLAITAKKAQFKNTGKSKKP